MLRIILDSSPLGLVSSPQGSPVVAAITSWSAACIAAGHKLYVPEVIDYEFRRELLRAGKIAGLKKLDLLKEQFDFLPISTAAMLRAAELWAQSRQARTPTGDSKKLDIDVILPAQALTLHAPLAEIIVATDNVGHLSRFVAADLWSNIHA